MSSQNMNYDQFQKMPLGMRRQILTMAADWMGDGVNPLFMAVYEHDPEPELRELAKQHLESHQITIPTEAGGNFIYTPQNSQRQIELTGGDGRYKTVEQLRYDDRLLLLNPRNAAYLQGTKPAPNSGSYRMLLLIGVFFLVVTIGLSQSRQPFIATVGSLVVTGIMFYSGYHSYQNDRLFAAEGKLLKGQVVSARGVWTTKTVNNRTRRSFELKVTFVVRKPDETKLYGTAALANATVNTPEPEPGTEIAILYLADHQYRTL